MTPQRCIVKSVILDGEPHTFWKGPNPMTARTRKRAVWHVIWNGKPRRMVTTLDRGLQEVHGGRY